MVDPEWDVADRMRKALRTSGIGVQQIADDLGVTRGAVGNWINGHVVPRRITLEAWAARTGVSLVWLQTGASSAAEDGEGPGGGQAWAGAVATDPTAPAQAVLIPGAVLTSRAPRPRRRRRR